jgi:hypothetical protein
MLEETREKPERKRGRHRPRSRPADEGGQKNAKAVLGPKVIFSNEVLPRLYRYVTRFFERHGNEVEIGGMWTGEFAMEKGWPTFFIRGFIEAGPNAEFSTDSILFDGDYQSRTLQAVRRLHPTIGNMGCFHVHPGQMDECSAGDYLADIAAVKESQTRALLFGIVTLDNPHEDPLSLCYANLKLDSFVLAEQTRFEYVHVLPVLVDVPAVDPPAEASAAEEVNGMAKSAYYGEHHSWCSGLLEDKKRLVAEVRAIEERYGDRAVLRHQRNQLFWEYTVVESGRRFPIEVRYPRRYPLEPPRIVSLLPLPSSPHQLVNNELCWINRAAGDWNPARDTAATCIHAAHRWFACLLVYLTLGKWPEEANDEPLRTI